MIIDSESKAEFRKQLSQLVTKQQQEVMLGHYPDLAAFERQRGVIVGLGLALDLLDDRPVEPQAEEKENEQQSTG